MLKNPLKIFPGICGARSFSATRQRFPILPDTLKTAAISLTSAKEKSESLLEQLKNINSICYAGGGERGRYVHVKKNKKVMPRERISQLFDEEDFLEISLQAGLGMPYGDIPAASLICGIGKIDGRYCAVVANDGTIKGGTSFPISVKKSMRIMDITLKCFLPHISLVDSGGAFLPLQSEIFPDKLHGGRVFYNIAVHSAKGIPQIALVCGSCTAGGAYVPEMSEDAAIVDGIGTLFLGGPPLVKAALGEDVSAEELGGATTHCSLSGGTDYFCVDEAKGFDVIKDAVSTINLEPEGGHVMQNECIYDPKTLNELCGLETRDRNAVYGIIGRIADGSRFREFKEKYGQNLVTGFSHLGRDRVGLLANCGPLTYKDALKGAQFIQLCEHRNIPLIFLQNSGPESLQDSFLSSLSGEEAGITLRARASMMSCLSCSSVFKVSLNIGGCHGDENYTMCGPSFEPNFLFAWPGADCSHSLHHASSQEAGDIDPPKKRSKSAFNFASGSCWHYSSEMINDGLIFPSDTRKVLLQCIEINRQRQRFKQLNKSFPVIRF